MSQPVPYRGPDDAMQDPYRQWSDTSHLKTLAICHYVWGGLLMAFACFGLFYVFMGIIFLKGDFPMSSNANPPPPAQWMGWFFIVLGGGFTLTGWVVGILTIFSGRCLARQRKRTFSLIVAGLNCLALPFGTVLGIFTFIVLLRPSVAMRYLSNRAEASPPVPPAVLDQNGNV